MRKLILIFCIGSFFGISQDSFGQRPIDPYGEIGITAGYSYYIGDINPYKHLGPRKKFAFGAAYRFNLTKRHALRIQGTRMHLEGYDSDNEDIDLINRNLNFRNKLTELALLLEINFHEYRLGGLGTGFTPYVFGGLAYFNMNPEAELDGSYFELIDIHTEAQGADGFDNPYKRGQVAIPFGIGFKAGFSDRLAINLEWGIRRTFTDYIDDVSGNYADPSIVRDNAGLQLAAELADRSLEPIGPDGSNIGMQRGNPESRDWYIYTGVILSVRLGKDGNGCWK
ncbi:MAG: hypothetical protein HKN45_00275 [Flavobacteriales bacterium]|nr:hypothetical protein [Flavobacteriales bacterium]